MGDIRGRFVGIMGPGRCGSSAVTGVLHHAGVPVGKELIGPHPRWNAKGHYEDRHMHWLNRLLAYRFEYSEAIRNETTYRYPELYKYDNVPVKELLEIYRQALAEREQVPVWAMKCIMLGLIYPHIEALLPQDRRLILVERDRDATIHSRMAHSQLSRDDAAALVDHLAQAARDTAASATCPVLVVRYEYLCEKPQSEVARILDFVSEDLPANLDYAAAIATIDAEMSHARLPA